VELTGPYINDPGYEVPDNNILVVPHSVTGDGYWQEIILPLNGEPKRDWFVSHFYYCLPLLIGNQYGFVIKSLRDFDLYWPGGTSNVDIGFLNDDNKDKQFITNGFAHGVVTIQNSFALKTPPGINLMTIQPPNMFIPACAAMTGVIETDNIRRDFTFNMRVTVPNYKIEVRKGDAVGAFLPIPRGFVDGFEVKFVEDVFSHEMRLKEDESAFALGREREGADTEKPHNAGRRYFNGVHPDDTKFKDHQKRLTGRP
jgi:hypothetical protein